MITAEELTFGHGNEVVMLGVRKVLTDKRKGRRGLPEMAKAAAEGGGASGDVSGKEREDFNEQCVGEIGDTVDLFGDGVDFGVRHWSQAAQ